MSLAEHRNVVTEVHETLDVTKAPWQRDGDSDQVPNI